MPDSVKDQLLALGDSLACPVCDQLRLDQSLVPFVGTVVIQRAGYQVRHRGSHMICPTCRALGGRAGITIAFQTWIAPPVKATLAAVDLTDSLNALLEVQPMQEPEPAGQYAIPLDLVYSVDVGREDPSGGVLTQRSVRHVMHYTCEEGASGTGSWIRKVERVL